MFRNYLEFASYGFCLRCRLLGFSSFMVWLRIWAFVFCVMTLFNEIVEFLVFWLMGKWWVWEIVTEPMHGCLCTPLIEGLVHHVVH